MRIQCNISNTGSDVRCPVCGQGVLITNAARQRDLARLQRRAVSQAMRDQHAVDGGHIRARFSADLAQAISLPTPSFAVTPAFAASL